MAPLIPTGGVAASILLLLAADQVQVEAGRPTFSFVGHTTASFSSVQYTPTLSLSSTIPRGGATLMEEDEYDSDIESSDVEDEEDIKMTKATISATRKAAAKATTAVKKEVNEKLATKKTAKKSSALPIPYILKALLNPITVIQMTKGYWASLFNLNYLKEDSSQDLRSALQDKAKKAAPSSGGAKGKRKMRPGQAKTLGDLPPLNT